MRGYTGHAEAWGSFVDVRINAAQQLANHVARLRPGVIGLSTVTDPYQPLERKYQLTRSCLAVLRACLFPVSILTKSPLVRRDIDVLRSLAECEVGLTVTTDDERMRRLFEPCAPPLVRRLEALAALKAAGLRTYAFVGPALPMNPQHLAKLLEGLVDEVLVDRMNYVHKVASLYRAHGLTKFLSDSYFEEVEAALSAVAKR
jgi:DNA repair photolyase